MKKASELRAEHEALKRERAEKSSAALLSRVDAEILAAHTRGATEVYSLSVNADVERVLKAHGYVVRFLRAAHMGDMDSHCISWKGTEGTDNG